MCCKSAVLKVKIKTISGKQPDLIEQASTLLFLSDKNMFLSARTLFYCTNSTKTLLSRQSPLEVMRKSDCSVQCKVLKTLHIHIFKCFELLMDN